MVTVIKDPATDQGNTASVDPGFGNADIEDAVDAEEPEEAVKPKSKKKAVVIKSKVELMDTGMVKEFTNTFRIKVQDVGFLRFGEDTSDFMYQLDHKGNGRYELRVVGE